MDEEDVITSPESPMAMEHDANAMEWARIVAQFYESNSTDGPIPFPEICFCKRWPHRQTKSCPVVSQKTHAARMKALGEILKHA